MGQDGEGDRGDPEVERSVRYRGAREIDIMANDARRIVDPIRKEVNVGLKRCTDMKGNRRVISLQEDLQRKRLY